MDIDPTTAPYRFYNIVRRICEKKEPSHGSDFNGRLATFFEQLPDETVAKWTQANPNQMAQLIGRMKDAGYFGAVPDSFFEAISKGIPSDADIRIGVMMINTLYSNDSVEKRNIFFDRIFSQGDEKATQSYMSIITNVHTPQSLKAFAETANRAGATDNKEIRRESFTVMSDIFQRQLNMKLVKMALEQRN